MSKKTIKPKPSPIDSTLHIKTTELIDQTVKFSFKYLDLANKKFSIANCKHAYYNTLLDRLKNLSGLKESELRKNSGKGLRSHSIKWSDTTEPTGFNHLKGQLRDTEGWQFQLSSNKHGRVHGFLLNSVFYVVWLDPAHRLYR